jgi:sec-independent protein translocase protein TatA
MSGIGAPELLIVLVVVLVLFGGAKLPKLARSLGEAQKEFKRGQDQPSETEAKLANEKVTMSKAELEALISEREAKARREAASD